MAIDLPDVEETWRANVAPYVAAMGEMIAAMKDFRDEALADIAEVQAALDSLHGGDINIGVDGTGAAAAAAASEDLAKAANDAAGAETREAAAAHEASGASRDAAGSAIDEAAAYKMVTDAMEDAAKAAALVALADEALAFAGKESAAVATAVAGSEHTASDALRGIIGAMRSAGTATRFFGLSLSALHWIVGVSAEALAVLVPAIIAFGAGLAVAMQGAVNAAGHMTALWTAAEATNAAFHQTMGTLLGLKPVLQQAQDAANPGVYELLGSAVNDAKTHMASLAGAGLDVVHMFDEFSARITVDMQQMSKSGEMDALLGNMVSDLQMLGQVFGNVGHAILNFAADMPGLAEVLLMIVDDISKVILWVSQLPHNFILVAMALEEFYRWGGLAASIIARLGLVLGMIGPAALAAPVALFGRLAGIMGAITGVGAQFVSGFAKVAQVVGRVVPVAGEASTGLYKMAGAMSAAAQDTALMGGIGIAVAATIGLVYALSQVKDATDQWVASTDKAVAAASDLEVYNVLGRTMQENAIKTQYATQALDRMQQSSAEGAKAMGGNTAYIVARFGEMNGEVQRSAQDVSDLTQQQQYLAGVARTVGGNIAFLGDKYHISGAAAQDLAQEAGVNLQHSLLGSGQAAQIARQQIANLVQGLGAMSAPAGVVGNDMEALGIQSQLAGTKVQQLNQAWDAWIGSVTGSMSAMAQVQTAIGTMASDASAKTAALTGAIGSVSLAGGQMSYTLKGMGQNAMQSWQQLTSAIGQGNSALDQLRVGMAEGVVTGGQFGSTVKGLVGEMIPFVAGNKTAIEMLSNLGHEAGGPVTTSLKQLEEWAGVKGKAAADQFSKGMNDASQAMGNMSKVAQDLSAVVSSDLDQALAASITKTSGVSSAVEKYSQDLANSNTPASVLHADVQRISQAMQTEQQMTAKASQGINQAGNAAAKAGGQFAQAAAAIHNYVNALDHIPSRVETEVVTNYVSTGYSGPGGVGHRVGAHGGMVGASGIIPSFAQGGVMPGFAPGVDNMLALLSGGEGILNPYATQMLGGKAAIDWLNSTAWHGGGAGGGAASGPAAGGGQVAENHVHVYLDGKEIYASVKQQNYVYGTRNAGSRAGLMTPGTRT